MSIKDIFTKKRIKVLIIGLIIVLTITAIIFIIARIQQGRVEPAVEKVAEEEEYTPPQSRLYTKYEKTTNEDLISQGKNEAGINPEIRIDDDIYSSIISNTNKINYYSNQNKKFIEYDLLADTQKELFSNIIDIDFNNLYDIEWSSGGDRVIIENNDGYYLLDTKTSQATTLPDNIFRPKWSPDGRKIVYQFISIVDNVNNITIADPNGSNWRNIAELDLDELSHIGGTVELGWSPDSRNVLYTYSATSTDGQQIYSVDIITGDTEIVESYGEPYGYLFSPDGSKILYTNIDLETSIAQIWAMDSDGNNKKYTGMDNVISKCVWKNNSVEAICTVSDDIYSYNQELTNDILVEYNIASDSTQQLTVFEQNRILDVRDLMVNKNDTILYFTNYDGKIYSLEL